MGYGIWVSRSERSVRRQSTGRRNDWKAKQMGCRMSKMEYGRWKMGDGIWGMGVGVFLQALTEMQRTRKL